MDIRSGETGGLAEWFWGILLEGKVDMVDGVITPDDMRIGGAGSKNNAAAGGGEQAAETSSQVVSDAPFLQTKLANYEVQRRKKTLEGFWIHQNRWRGTKSCGNGIYCR